MKRFRPSYVPRNGHRLQPLVDKLGEVAQVESCAFFSTRHAASLQQLIVTFACGQRLEEHYDDAQVVRWRLGLPAEVG